MTKDEFINVTLSENLNKYFKPIKLSLNLSIIWIDIIIK